MFYSTILAIVASPKFEEFKNECPHYTPSKAL